ncbi:MAG TPA: Fe-S cluster assembly protein SufD [Burkholderiales bacterium]|jgi:Fe-S cluster assembly protein SufD|nr:Fe-S cluster assembly protein SufD [Burkholderiales bacterium]
MTVARLHNDAMAWLAPDAHELPSSPLTWLNRLRSDALERANELTVPTTRDEEWRFTDLSPLIRLSFQPSHAAPALAASDVAPFEAPEAVVRLVFVDGIFSPALSSNGVLPDSVAVTNLAAALKTHGEIIEPHLGHLAGFQDNVFTALNTAFMHDGAAVIIGRGQRVSAPVHLLFISARPETASYPRTLVIAEEGAEAVIIEDHVSIGNGVDFSNAVTEIAVAANARVKHVKLQRDNVQAFHIANCSAALERDAVLSSCAVTLGGRLSRYNLNVAQQGEGAQCEIDGLTLISGRQLADSHTMIDHAAPHGRSRQINKCIVGGGAHAVFNGKIVVRPGAQLVNSAQESRNLLLSGRARIDTKPQLEIFADDVKCAHGATVGQLEPEQVFYLVSRGLSESMARNLLTYAFGAEIINRIPVPSLVERLQKAVLEHTQVAS